MPVVPPPGGPVNWPANEGALGIVGVAPWATIQFAEALYALIRAEKDWDYPRVIFDVNTKIPSRGRHLELGETDPSPTIAATIAELASGGATVVVVACNTAHILYDRWALNAPVPVPHIVAETVKAASTQGARRVASFTSTSLSRANLYRDHAVKAGLAAHALSDSAQQTVSDMIGLVKAHGSVDSLVQSRWDELVTELKAGEVDTVLLGCTELSILQKPLKDIGIRSVDSNAALAHSALRLLNLGSRLAQD